MLPCGAVVVKLDALQHQVRCSTQAFEFLVLNLLQISSIKLTKCEEGKLRDWGLNLLPTTVH